MDRMGHHQIQTTQKYLHALSDADEKNLDALDRIARGRAPDDCPALADERAKHRAATALRPGEHAP
jgi:hypothetical protein